MFFWPPKLDPPSGVSVFVIVISVLLLDYHVGESCSFIPAFLRRAQAAFQGACVLWENSIRNLESVVFHVRSTECQALHSALLGSFHLVLTASHQVAKGKNWVLSRDGNRCHSFPNYCTDITGLTADFRMEGWMDYQSRLHSGGQLPWGSCDWRLKYLPSLPLLSSLFRVVRLGSGVPSLCRPPLALPKVRWDM